MRCIVGAQHSLLHPNTPPLVLGLAPVALSCSAPRVPPGKAGSGKEQGDLDTSRICPSALSSRGPDGRGRGASGRFLSLGLPTAHNRTHKAGVLLCPGSHTALPLPAPLNKAITRRTHPSSTRWMVMFFKKHVRPEVSSRGTSCKQGKRFPWRLRLRRETEAAESVPGPWPPVEGASE